MKTLILNGSPKPNGDTSALLNALTADLRGEVRALSCFSGIAACNDCRFCWTKPGCAIQDGMQEIYPYLAQCDNIVLASPIWFSSLSGPLLNLASRMQTLYCATAFRGEPPAERSKNGVILLCGAEPHTAERPKATALTIMKFMGVNRDAVTYIASLDTNNTPAARDAEALRQCREAAALLNARAGL